MEKMVSDDIVCKYLLQVKELVDTLCVGDCQAMDISTDNNLPADTVDLIAKKMLMEVCSVEAFMAPLPQSLILDTSRESNVSPYGPNNSEGARYVCVVKTRSDAMRYLFYALAPIALDVGVRIATLVQSFHSTDEKIPPDISLKAFLLFSLWLPHAPQLSPLVSELFDDDRLSSPFEQYVYNNPSTKQQPRTDDRHDASEMTDIYVTESITHNAWCVIGEAAHSICKFFYDRGDCNKMRLWWDWSILFKFLPVFHTLSTETSSQIEELISEINSDVSTSVGDIDTITRWHAARALAYLFNLRPSARLGFLQYLDVDEEKVPWTPHPWVIIDEETRVQEERIRGFISILKDNSIHLVMSPGLENIRNVIPLHRHLVDIGHGLLMYREGKESYSFEGASATDNRNALSRLIMTPTTARNLAMLGTALCTDPYPTPILVCGPRGAGKSSIIRELASYRSKSSCTDDLLELHVDDEIDSKTLLGMFTISDVPGEFTWRPGPLTIAARTGKWVLIEDLDLCPVEIQAALVSLLEHRILPLGTGRNEKCHANFRIFGTCTTRASTSKSDSFYRGRKVLHSDLWTQVQVVPLPYNELSAIGIELFPTLPVIIIDTVMKIFRMIDSGSRGDCMNSSSQSDYKPHFQLSSDRGLTSVRDLIKLLRRISTNGELDSGTSFITESQRIICLVETYDVLVADNDDINGRLRFLTNIAAPAWGLSSEVAHKHVVSRCPVLRTAFTYLEIGRCTLPYKMTDHSVDDREMLNVQSRFSKTSNVLRLMETLGVCLQQNEPILLVGETGCGKTSIVQMLSKLAGFELVVQNLSLQTDTADLLGGYRPVEIQLLAREVYLRFADLFASTFSRAQNSDFLMFVSSAHEQKRWKVLSQCFNKASKMGLNKLKDSVVPPVSKSGVSLGAWEEFSLMVDRFERQRALSESGMAFSFIEGALVEALKNGKWVLLDEINLASSETLQRLCSLLDDARGSLTLTERGDAEPIKRHPDFRLIAAMNPATDNGKKDIPSSIRSRFTEIYVDELVDRIELSSVAGGYLNGVIHISDVEQSETIMSSVDVYLRCRKLSVEALVDSVGQRPRYSMRTFCRALSATRNLTVHQHLPLNRAMLEGFELTFEGSLETGSRALLKSTLFEGLGKNIDQKVLDIPGRRPGGRNGTDDFILVKPFWLKAGPLKRDDWSTEVSNTGKCRFVLTATTKYNIRRLSRAISAGPWPILLEGPTSTGKTTMVEYMAALCGHRCIRINNHEYTDVQEYTGTYTTNPNGQLSFQEGLLVQALRHGYWVILDELNLAPSQVLEALNRLLDDNRELYIPEINEIVRPHENFRLFATQNPSGLYGGRKALSKAFRNRFTELYIDEIPEGELIMILDKRCGCPPSHGKLLVEVMSTLRKKRSKSGVFFGKDGLITPRILIRWAERSVASKTGLATEGYMILAERLRDDEEKKLVQSVLERVFKVNIEMEELYWGPLSGARKMLEILNSNNDSNYTRGLNPLSIAPTKSFLRLITLVDRCVKQKEPVLLVGETGCGKTTVVQVFEILLRRQLQTVNCHANTDTSDLLGGLRPLRGRSSIRSSMIEYALQLEQTVTHLAALADAEIPSFEFVNEEEHSSPQDKLVHRVMDYAKLVESLCGSISDGSKIQLSEETGGKRRKLDYLSDIENIKGIISTIRDSFKKYFSLFEWVDGPLISAMKAGHLLLLDEMSLAEDAVLERLNSVLEPSRKMILAEKGSELTDGVDSASLEIEAHDNFRIFATMNPGGDFGKRELSPALRSRFTEIWVPPIIDRYDIDLVLERSLASTFEKNRCTDEILLRECMLDYVEWFNNHLYTAFKSPKCELVLSLRDVLTWSIFIAQQNSDDMKSELSILYVQGASLMHLDGLGLGTGLAREEANEIKQTARQFLARQTVVTRSRISTVMSPSEPCFYWSSDNGKYGIHPFFTAAGPYPVTSSLNFNLDAPTTRANIFRVLRAMQLSKPILLEGSPGTGKTSLLAALANATGHNLVRINLSEQTDWSDLMGSDLPVADDGECGSFKWCDGMLLTAIKNGDWVVLDELNLATQSVLEGLNSCLDHRASVYIPELGITYSCPKSFRVFAAQNPLFQGGGRKGLPRSFLNRFTKVYVESMIKEDYMSIMSKKFPNIPMAVLQQMIEFNSQLENDITMNKLFGLSGSPWEFNLRDLFRWGDLIENRDGTHQPSTYVDTVYIRRLRCDKDRETALHIFNSIFNGDKRHNEYPMLRVEDDRVYCGSAMLLRLDQCFFGPEGRRRIRSEDSCYSRSLLLPMEVAANCIRMNWPCLLVGVGGSGKSTIIKSLSDLCNANLEELCLTPSTDVSELIGSFEQTDNEAVAVQFFNDLVSHVISLSLMSAKDINCTKYTIDINTKLVKLVRKHEKNPMKSMANKNWLSDCTSRAVVDEVMQSLSLLHQMCRHKKLSDMFMILRRQYDEVTQFDSTPMRFRWVDGILVQALEKGYWLHLENVNLCSSSVLDRLNPLLENGGELVLTECSIPCGGSNQHRVIKAHPNFRLLLSMDPSHGEISRAMRNRCVEIYLLIAADDSIIVKDPLNDPQSSTETMDALECMWDSGIRSPALARSALGKRRALAATRSFYNKNITSLRYLNRWTRALTAGILRGFPLRPLYDSSLIAVYSYMGQDETEYLNELQMSEMFALVEGHTLRRLVVLRPSSSRVWLEARLLKTLSAVQESLLPSGVSCFSMTNGGSHCMLYDEFCLPSRYLDRPVKGILNYLSVDFVMNHISQNTVFRSKLFDGYKADLSISAKLLVTHYLQTMSRLLGCSSMPVFDDSSIIFSQLRTLTSHRLLRLLEEHQLMEKIRSFPDNCIRNQASVLEISMSIVFDRFDRANTKCPLTPLVYPLIRALDDFLDASSILLFKSNATPPQQLFAMIDSACAQGYNFWRCLCNLQYSNQHELVGFDSNTFCVQFRWMKKRLAAILSAIKGIMIIETKLDSSGVDNAYDRLEGLMNIFDNVFFINNDDILLRSDIFWKRMGHPLVPAKADDHENVIEMHRAAACYSLWYTTNHDHYGHEVPIISIAKLLEKQHPIIYIEFDQKVDALNTLCMALWATTDEASSCSRITPMAYDTKKAIKALKDKIMFKSRDFQFKLQQAVTDAAIETYENQLNLDEMKLLNEHRSTDSDSTNNMTIQENLLRRYATIQISPLAELWCIQEERSLVQVLLQVAFLGSDHDVTDTFRAPFIQRIEAFIQHALTFTSWSSTDLRPYRTITWACTVEQLQVTQIRNILRSCSSLILTNFYLHCWFNGYNDTTLIDRKLTLPDYLLEPSEPKGDHRLNDTDAFIGPPRLRHNPTSDVFFNIMNVDEIVLKYEPWLSLENFEARLSQYKNLIVILSSPVDAPNDELNLSRSLFSSFLESLSVSLGYKTSTGQLLRSTLAETGPLPTCDVINEIVSGCRNQVIAKLMDSVIRPLTLILSREVSSLSKEDVALGLIYVGLLRFHILIPRSNADPGRKPAIKAIQLDEYLSVLDEQLAARRLISGLDCGDFSPNDNVTLKLLHTVENARIKRDGHFKKRIERPKLGPSFSELYREISLFSENIASVNCVLKLLGMIDSIDSMMETLDFVRQTERSWQQSVHSFVRRMRSHYCYFDDVTVPFLSAIQTAQYGVRELIALKLKSINTLSIRVLQTQDSLLTYPIKNIRPLTEEILLKNLDAIKFSCNGNLSGAQVLMAQESYICSVLSRLGLYTSLSQRPTSYEQISLMTILFDRLLQLGSLPHDVSTDHLSYKTGGPTEEFDEKQFRRLFPDHEADFPSSEEANLNETAETIDNRRSINSFSDNKLIFLYGMYLRFFKPFVDKVDDDMRIQDFMLAYTAAGLLHKLTSSLDRVIPERNRLGAHLCAFLLNLSPEVDSLSILSDRTFMARSSKFDFHHDPCPWETIRAKEPLESIQNRIMQLLSAFPSNSILIAIYHVVKRLRQYDLKRTSLGKMLTGLEVVLRRAQDWEQHASIHVSLGQSLTSISGIVSKWRKLELESWPQLLDSLEMRQSHYAQNFWFKLYHLIITNVKGERLDSTHRNNKLRAIPDWVKDECAIKNYLPKAELCKPHLIDLVKAADTFLLTATIGQYVERLRMIEAFARHQILDYGSNPRPFASAKSIGLMLEGLFNYYGQFVRKVNEVKNRSRILIEKKLSDEAKLAKWDEQSYYSLADSSDKNHRKLMKHLKEYDEVLETPVCDLIEEEMIDGIRSKGIENSSNSMLSDEAMFPYVYIDEIGSNAKAFGLAFPDDLSCFVLESETTSNLIKDKWILNINKYHQKLVKMMRLETPSPSENGASALIVMTTSIFDRLKVLRVHGSKNLKQRALLDLFKTLKDQGFATGMMPARSNIREMSSLLQIPAVVVQGSSSSVQSAERYFQRCLSETTRLRDEVKNYGSQYMNQHEMNLMLGYSEHCLLMLCQQRSVLASVFEDIDAINRSISFYENVEFEIPCNQAVLVERVAEFEDAYLVAEESLAQLLLILKTGLAVQEVDQKGFEKVSHVTSSIDRHVELLRTLYHPPRDRHMFISRIRLDELRPIRDKLVPIIDDIAEHICDPFIDRLVPKTIFNCCLENLKTLLLLADECISVGCLSNIQSTKSICSDASQIEETISSVIQKSLLVAQMLNNSNASISEIPDEHETSFDSVWENHQKAIDVLSRSHIDKMISLFNKLTKLLVKIEFVSISERLFYAKLLGGTTSLVRTALALFQRELIKLLEFYRNGSKFLYIIIRIFRTLIAQGYCSEDIGDNEKVQGGDINSTKFDDDVAGTGMGEGEGKVDVSDQIENEEQLLGLKGENNKDSGSDSNQANKELNEDEAEKGMEMEADFEGELFEAPKQQNEKAMESDENMEEIDRELGDSSDPNEEVIDEKLWDNDDDENANTDEKFEKNSKLSSVNNSDEFRTKDDQDDIVNDAPSQSQKTDEHNTEQVNGQDNELDSPVNEDLEENYEDRHEGISIRGEDDHGSLNGMDELNMDQSINLDCNDSDDSNDLDNQDGDFPDSTGSPLENDLNEGVSPESNEPNNPEVSEVQSLDDNEGSDTQGDHDLTKQSNDMMDDDHTTNENALGVPYDDGTDEINETGEKRDSCSDLAKKNEKERMTDAQGKDDGLNDDGGQSGTEGDGIQSGNGDNLQSSSSAHVPNPFRDPGNAEKYWHRRLNILQDSGSNSNDGSEERLNDDEMAEDHQGTFEFTKSNQSSSTQALAAADEIIENNVIPEDTLKEVESHSQVNDPMESMESQDLGTNQLTKEKNKTLAHEQPNKDFKRQDTKEDDSLKTSEKFIEREGDMALDDQFVSRENHVVADIGFLQDDKHNAPTTDFEQKPFEILSAPVDAVSIWGQLQSETHHLSRRLCEKLRLVMEPLVASKLQGDYRSGKRLNMKRIISYIASGYRKDKIWLRRTKPAKRDYRVLLAVDDSESMHRSGAGLMALRAMAMLINGMTQLEIGQLGIASFGEEMKILHPFQSPFTSDSGAFLVGNFKFEDKRTRTALCVESAMSCMAQDSSSSSPQLLILISDGRIERDSRLKLRSSLREMSEQNILVVMLIVEGFNDKKKRDSIVDMKEVSFEDGRPKVNFFMDNYPFPYYIIVEDMATLPDVLGDALRQWFEILAQTQR